MLVHDHRNLFALGSGSKSSRGGGLAVAPSPAMHENRRVRDAGEDPPPGPRLTRRAIIVRGSVAGASLYAGAHLPGPALAAPGPPRKGRRPSRVVFGAELEYY